MYISTPKEVQLLLPLFSHCDRAELGVIDVPSLRELSKVVSRNSVRNAV